MNMKALSQSRRTFLRGTGVALALPWFETFATSAPGSDETPKRFLSVYHPDGVGLPLKSDPAWKDWCWFPRGGEKDFELTKVLDVLQPLRNDITIYSGFSHPAARQVHGHSNADQYLTGAPIGGSGPYQNSISVDQVYAEYACAVDPAGFGAVGDLPAHELIANLGDRERASGTGGRQQPVLIGCG